MKSIKRCFLQFIGFFTLLLFIVPSCQIGLGSSVDTEAPELMITGPEAASIIRGNFAINGTWADDGEIESVTCVLTETESKELTYSFTADFTTSKTEVGKGSWSAIVEKDSIRDGSYEAAVTIEDKAGHKTKATRQITVDNTAPVVVLKRPSSKKGQTDDIDGYGQVFSLKGLAADDSGVGRIEINIYDDENLTTLLKTITKTNVPNTISLDVAEFEEGVENDYSVIYGSTNRSSGVQKRYCRITAYDGAQQYPTDGSEQTDDDKKGNASTSYYLYEDISSTLLAQYKITEIYAIKNGTYNADSSVRSAVTTSLGESEIEVGMFTLNPANEPKYTVSGYSELNHDGKDFATEARYVKNGTTLNIDVKPGLDSYAILSDTLKVSLQKCDSLGNGIGSLIKPAYTIETKGTSYSISVKITKDDGLKIGETYLIKVEGQDEKGNNVATPNGKGYGFYLDSSGVKPTIKVTFPESDATVTYKEDTNPASITISGTAFFPSDTFDSKDGATVLIRNSSGTLNWDVTTLTDSQTDTDVPWTITLDFKKGRDQNTDGALYLPDGNHSLGAYIISGSDFDTAEYKVKADINIRLDTQKPKEPVLTKLTDTSEKAYAADTWYSAQDLKATLTVGDIARDGYASSSTSSALLSTEYKNGEDGTWKSLSSPTGGYITELVDGENTLYFRSTDAVGNVSEVTRGNKILVDTLVPEIIEAKIGSGDGDSNWKTLTSGSVLNIGNSFGKNIKLTIKEARLLNAENGVTVKVGGNTLEGTCTRDGGENSTSEYWTWTSSAPASFTADKETAITVVAKDGAGGISETVTYSLLVDTKGPVIEILSPAEELKAADSAKTEFTFKASINDEKGNVSETKYRYVQDLTSNTAWETATNKGSINQSVTLTEGYWYFCVKSTDEAGNESSKNQGFWVDENAPALGTSTKPEAIYNYNDLTNGDGTIALAGTATDTHGVEKLQYSTDGTNWNDASITAGTASSWNISIPFGTGGLSDGTKTIYAKAVDKAGRESTESYEILIDTNKPSLGTPVIAETKNSEGWYNDSELNVSVEASDTTGGSGVSLVQYSLDNSKWTPLSYNEKTKKYEGPVKFSSNGDDLKLYIKATDKADNDSDIKELPLKIDSGSPVIVAKYYKAGTQGQFGTFGGNAYINNTKASEVMKVWGQCSDSVSGIAGLEAYIGSTKITGLTFKYSSSALPVDESALGDFSETCDSIASWYVEIPTTKFTSDGALTIKALDNAGNSTTAQQTTTVVIDTKEPAIQSSSVIIAETTTGAKTSAYRYSESDSEIVYYVNNLSGKTFQISGSSTDDYGISATTITINGVNHDASNAQSWNFSGDDFKLSDITGDSTEVKVTAKDKAGNTCEKKITINFDKTSPEFTHRVDANGKDLDFRIGGDVDVTQDIGGKYKTGSWSTSNTLTVRGTTEESGSGLARIYYKVFNSVPNAADIASFESDYQTEKTGTIEVSGSAGKRTVDYTTKDENGNEGRDSLEIESSYKGTLTGLYEGINYLLLIAEDKVGNTAIDSLTATAATGVSLTDAVKTAWNGNNKYYSLNIDTKAPSLTSASSGTKYTNGKSDLEVSGTCSDLGSGIKDLVVSVQIGTDTKTADIVYDTTDPTKWTATFEASEDSSLGVSGGTRYNIDAVATDVAGLSSTLTIAVLQGDTQAPTATLTNVSPSAKESTSGAYYINPSKEIKVEGSTEDDYSTSIETWLKLVPVTSGVEEKSSAVYINKESPKTTRSWSITIDADKIPVGTYTGYNIYACTEDQAGNKQESTKRAQITFDNVGPTYIASASGDYVTKVGQSQYWVFDTDGTTLKENEVWQKDTTLALEGAWQDVSGVGDIYYKVVNGSITAPSSKADCSSSFSVTESNGYAVFNTSIDGFVKGENKIYLFATDKLDNVSTAATILTVNVDTNEPVANTYTDTDGVEYKFDAVYLSDGKSDKILYFYADDTLSGIDTSVTPTITLGGESVTKGSNARFEGSETDEGYLVKVTMKADDVKEKSGFRSVEVTVQDKAGNKANLEIATMNVDTTAPTVTLSNPDDADTDTSDIEVNGTITISGNASDPYIAARPLSALQYSTDKTNWTNWVTDFSAVNTNVTNSENFTVKVDTTLLDDGTYYIRAAAKDDAGNEGWSWTTKDTTDPLKIVVKQDTDRPLITLKDIKIPTVAATDTNVTLGLAKRELRGTVTDDDGVKTFEISYKGGEENTWKTITVGKGGSWSDSDSDAIKTDGTYDIVFRVTDNSSDTGKAFTSVISGTTTGDTPKFRFSNDEGTVTHDYNTLPLSLIVDNAAPVSSSITFAYYDGTYSETNPASSAYSDTIPTVGGKRKKLAIKIDASDANKIAGISSSLDGTVSKVGDETYNETDKVYYSTWVLKDIDVSGLDSGLTDLTLTITDGAGNKNTNKYQMVVDNTAPTLSVSEPSSTSTNSGSVTVSGEIDSSDARYLYYAISPSGDKKKKPNADSTGTTTVTSWETPTSTVTSPAISAKPVYSDSISFGISWRIAFDGNTSNTTSPHADLLSSYLEEYGITSDASTFDKIVKLYLWVKAVDAVGNENEIVYPIIYDPQGDKPEVKISYPDDNSNGTTLARQTDIYGTHQDLKGSSGNIGVDSVWVQIISEAHKTSTVSIANKLTYSASKEIETFNITKADLDYMASNGYNVYNMKEYDVDGTNTKWKSDGSSDKASGESYSDYAALATVSGASWRLTIDENDEFNPITGQTDGKNPVGIRVFARDKDKKLSSPADRLVFFDSNAPIIENLKLVRKNGSTVVSERPYSADMYISFKKLNESDSPKWFIEGLAADDGQITEVTINNDVQTITAAQLVNFSYELVKPANAGDAGAITFVITAKDNVTDPKPNEVTENISIKYDDVSPVVTTSGTNFNIESTVRQSQGLYTFGSLANEDSIVVNNTSYAQSGYAYTAFFFKRQYGTTTKVYDVLNSSSLVASTDNTDVTGSVVLPSALTQADGLYWYEKTVTRDETNLNELTMTDVTGVHTNALVKIGGAYYLVTDVSGSKVTIDGYPDASYETAYVAVAGIIDNTGSRDDGDNMAESVVKTGTSWAWEASVVSSNISDGPIDLVYVVFDKAGNYTENSVHGIISNNPPRLAGFTIKTDYNGDNDVTSATKDGKYEEYKSTVSRGYNPTAMDYSMTAGTSAIPVLKLRGKTVITPEIVGGTGNVYYDYKIGDGSGDKSGSNAKELFTGSTDGSVKSADINIQLGDLKKFGDVASTPFAFTFRDSIEGRSSILADNNLTDDQKNSVSAELTVYMGIATAATTNPTVEIDPFYWNSSEDNSVYDSNGHIELEDDWKDAEGYDSKSSGTQYDSDPKVSGQIVIKGRAHDDNRIESINVNFATSADTFINEATVAIFENGALTSYAPKEASDLLIGYSDNGFWFEITNETFAASGHDVEWKLYLNTEAKGGAAIDAALTVTATNCGTPACTEKTNTDATLATDLSINGEKYYTTGTPTGNKSNTPGSDQTKKDPKTAYYRMDIVPYITGVETDLSSKNTTAPSVYNRTARGHYPVYSYFASGSTATETNSNYSNATYETVKLSGYNLTGGKVDFEGVATASRPDYAASGVKIPAAAKSGKVNVYVGSIKSLNNVNNNDSHGGYDKTTTDVQGDYTVYSNYYNRTPNNKNNNILTDDVYFDIWDFNNQAALAYGNGKVDNLEMKINPANGIIGFAFSNGSLRFSMPDYTTNSYKQWNTSYDYMSYNALAYDSFGYSYAVSVGGDINSGDTVADNYSFMTNRWGVVGNNQSSNVGSAYNHIRLDTIGQTGGSSGTLRDKGRFQNSSFATHKNGTASTDIYLAYYDYLNGEIRFKAGTMTETTTAGFNNFQDIGGNTARDYSTNAKYCQIIAKNGDTTNTLGSAGKYVSIGVTTSTTETDDNVVVIIWYDGTNLMYAYNTTPLANVGQTSVTYAKNTGWTGVQTLLSNAGEYCQLAVGNDGSIHIAAYDSTNANLKYIYLSKYDSTTPVVATVDSYLDVGEQLTIDVAEVNGKQIPYIGYWAAYPEKPRYAYLAEPETFYAGTVRDGAVDNKYTGVWECTVVPSQSSVKDSRKISVGVWKYNGTAEDDGKLAYSTTGTKRGKADGDNKYDESTATDSTGTCYGNGTSNGVLAYVVAPTSSQYCAETAQMR